MDIDFEIEDINTYNTKESFPMLMNTCAKMIKESLNVRFEQEGYNVTCDQWIALIHLWEQDGLTQQALADRVGRSKVAVFNILKRLEKLGLVERHPDPIDGRTKRVYLSSEGRKIQPSLIPIAKQNVINISKDISNEEIEQLKSILRRIMNNIKN